MKSKKEMRVMLKLRGGTAAFQMETSTGGRERRKRIRYARSVKVVKWRMSLIGVLLPSLEQPSTATAAIALPSIEEEEQIVISCWLMHVETIAF